MQARSVATRHTDPYRAGLELAAGLAEIEPEVVFLFGTMHSGEFAEIGEAIREVLGSQDVVLIGTTGDGFFETDTTAALGASALGLNSGGKAIFHVAATEGVSADARGAVGRCMDQLQQGFGDQGPALGFLVCDFQADGSRLMEALAELVPFPIVGGFAGADRRMAGCSIYAGDGDIQDGLVILGIGGDINFDIHVGAGMMDIGSPGRVTAAQGRTVTRIDDLSTMEFVEKVTGKPVEDADKGILAFSVVDPVHRDRRYLRSVSGFNTTDGSVSLFGGVEPGQEIQLCIAHPDRIIEEVRRIGERVGQGPWTPRAGIIVSCAGRKWVLGNRISHEVQAIIDGAACSFPLAGFPSFGEVGPARGATDFTATLFHNVTYILLLFGD